MVIFKKNDFSGGLDRQLDAAKSAENAYPLLVNARTRENVVRPVNKHVKIEMPTGNYQGLYAAGQYLVLFVSGQAYYADITAAVITFLPVANWVTMATDVPRLFAEIVPATANFFNHSGEPLDPNIAFNGTIKAFSQALFVFDGITQPQAILPDGTARVLKTYADWTKNNPEYVPVAKLPSVCGNKLFAVAPDGVHVLHSVTGRCSDFVINIIPATGEKGGNADTVAQTVSYNQITALKSLSTSQVFVGTLYGSFVLDLDYDNAQFNEPYLRPTFLFPTGPLNEISMVDVLSDTAMITQSGIHAFNAVAQAKKESNNFPIGAKIRGLLKNPQANTCAGQYDDYAFFAVNTIHGYGALVFDTITQGFQSLDLSFGRVKQFATTKISGYERMFFITHNNEIYEAFAGTEKAIARMYIGEFTPQNAPETAMISIINAMFANVKSSGTVKMTLFGDNVEFDSVSYQCTKNDYTFNPPIPIPFVKTNQVFSAEWQTRGVSRAWRTGLLVEWDFEGDLTDVSFDGQIDKGPSVTDTPQLQPAEAENYAFFANSGSTSELNTGGDFPAEEFIEVTVVKGESYIYDANGNGVLLNGNQQITRGTFVAKTNTVQVHGNGTKLFTLRKVSAYMDVLARIYADKDISRIFHGGNFAYPQGRLLDVTTNQLPVKLPIHAAVGETDLITSDGTYYFNYMGIPNYYSKRFGLVDVFFYNSDITAPDGFESTSIQAAACKNWAVNSTARYKIVVVPDAPYTTALDKWPGRSDLRFFVPFGIHAILSGGGRLMERFDVNGFPYLVCGAGGQDLAMLEPGTETTVAFRNNTDNGFIKINADELRCRFTFVSAEGLTLDTFDVYP